MAYAPASNGQPISRTACHRIALSRALAGILLGFVASTALARGVYQTPRAFLEESFDGDPPPPQRLWITDRIQGTAQRILGHRLGVLRLRYWERDGRTAWILEEIGKERPITVGVVISGNAIERIKVLVFRESRGWEVRYSFFTGQFRAARLTDEYELDRPIDGITGATLSVRALTRLARLALFLHAQTEFGHD